MLQAFIQGQYKFSELVSLTSGIHSLFFTLNRNFSIEPRIALKWNIGVEQSLNFGLGLHSQMQPRMSYFYRTLVDTLTMTYIQTNKNVKFSKSIHAITGYDFLITKALRLKSELYFQYLYNIPITQSRPQFSMINAGDFFGLPSEDSLLNKGKGYNYGMELTLEQFLKNNFYYLFTASLFQSKYKAFENIWRNTAFNGNFIFNMLEGYEFKIKNNISLLIDIRTVWAGGKRRVPIDLEKSIQKNYTVHIWEKAYNKRYPDYFRIDSRFAIQINKKRISQSFAIDLQNITGHKNIFMEGFNTNSKTITKDYQFGFFPVATYKLHF